ncbi:Nucleosome assembly protein 1-like 5 [Cricetulus griseus]|uniref:Nucleosome assembly protein 1-like 5 n=1 Tax=Cricetulus griseus TaxID=10029 RepID=G3I6M5_CRIGR|nr:Nucleosome assembly protein 1-like 5 [Cricetulus griseus]
MCAKPSADSGQPFICREPRSGSADVTTAVSICRIFRLTLDQPQSQKEDLSGPAQSQTAQSPDHCAPPAEPSRTLAMADPEKQGPAESRAEDEVMEGAQGGEDVATGGEGAAAPAAEEPQATGENAPKPKNEFIESLPNSVKCRVLALKKLQKRCDKIEAKFDKEFQALEKKYNDIYKPLLAKIQELTGEMEGCAWTLEEDDDDDEEEDEEEEEEEEEAAAGATGGPDSAKK